MQNAINNTNIIPSVVASSYTFTAKNTKLFSYAGSKGKYEDVFDNVHSKTESIKVKTYIEGFSGTLASVMHNLKYVKAETIILNDINKKLINLYYQIQINHTEVIEKYKLLEAEFNRIIPEKLKNIRVIPKKERELFQANQNFFLEARALLNSIEDGSNKAALWLFVMNHNFNGLYSENKKGESTPSFNWSSKIVNIKTIEEAIQNLHRFFTMHNVVFENIDINDLIDKYDEEDTFIYLDPPYINSKIQYSSKNKDSFEHIQRHKDMIDKCSKYKYVLYSNNHDEAFVEIFDTYVNFSRTNSISKNDNSTKLEILAFKVNQVGILKPTPIIELLGIQLDRIAIQSANNITFDRNETEKVAVSKRVVVPKNITSILNIDIQSKHSKDAS